MAKSKKKHATELTTDEALHRLFGKRGAAHIRKVLEQEEARKPERKSKKR
jgi:hypothetical protein